MTDTARHGEVGGIGEVEALCAELCAELVEMRDMATLHRGTVADAARCIAAALADQLILPVTDPRGHDLAAALARIGGNGAEVDALLSIPTETLRAAAARQPEPRLTGSGMNNVVVSP